MSILGTWNVTQQSIVGTTDSVWTFTQEGGRVVCDIAHNTAMGAVAKDVKVNGNEVTLFLSLAKPVATSANVTLHVTGDAFTGEGKVRFLPAAKLTGTRVVVAPAPPAPSSPLPPTSFQPAPAAPAAPYAAPQPVAPPVPPPAPVHPASPSPQQPWPGV